MGGRLFRQRARENKYIYLQVASDNQRWNKAVFRNIYSSSQQLCRRAHQHPPSLGLWYIYIYATLTCIIIIKGRIQRDIYPKTLLFLYIYIPHEMRLAGGAVVVESPVANRLSSLCTLHSSRSIVNLDV